MTETTENNSKDLQNALQEIEYLKKILQKLETSIETQDDIKNSIQNLDQKLTKLDDAQKKEIINNNYQYLINYVTPVVTGVGYFLLTTPIKTVTQIPIIITGIYSAANYYFR